MPQNENLTRRICVRVSEEEYWFLRSRRAGTSRYIRKLIQWAMKWAAARAQERAKKEAAAQASQAQKPAA